MALAMEIRQPSNSKDAKHYDTDRLREEFLIEEIFVPGEIRRIYSHIDRIITMGYTPTDKPLELGEGLNTCLLYTSPAGRFIRPMPYHS